ncbi:MAG: DUF6146 family protein [Flavobacteriaceae bacterium]
MKRLIYIILFICTSCASTVIEPNLTTNNDKLVIENKELEYEVIIIEPGFNSWLVTQMPMSYYSQPTLELKNTFFITSWNQRVLQPFKYNTNLYEMRIDYDSQIDYGLEVNYKLFMYFTYFQQKYKQKL